MSRSIRRLPDGELAVMQALWACEAPASGADLEARLQSTHPMAPTTVLTILTRLGEKGFVAAEKSGRRRAYRPLISRSDYLAAQSGAFFRGLCGGSVSTFAAALCDSGLSREELAQLPGAAGEGRPMSDMNEMLAMAMPTRFF